MHVLCIRMFISDLRGVHKHREPHQVTVLGVTDQCIEAEANNCSLTPAVPFFISVTERIDILLLFHTLYCLLSSILKICAL